MMAQKIVNGGGRGGNVIVVTEEKIVKGEKFVEKVKYRVNPTKDITSFGALASCAWGLGNNSNGVAAAAKKSKPEPESIRQFH